MLSDLYSRLIAIDFSKATLSDIDVTTTLMDPPIIALAVIICIALLICKRHRPMVTFLTILAFVVLFEQTAQGMDFMKLENHLPDLYIFVGGFLALAGVNAYVYFVR
jgi:hypothetical protein